MRAAQVEQHAVLARYRNNAHGGDPRRVFLIAQRFAHRQSVASCPLPVLPEIILLDKTPQTINHALSLRAIAGTAHSDRENAMRQRQKTAFSTQKRRFLAQKWPKLKGKVYQYVNRRKL
jgi:hypothetical protein